MSILSEHVYKTAFAICLEQFYYKRMRIKFIEVLNIYFQLKNIIMNLIFLSNMKSVLNEKNITFKYFINND